MRQRATREEVRTRTKKRCSTCRRIKPLSDFHKSSRSGDGRKTVCRSCRSEYAKAHPTDHWRSRYDRHRNFMDEQKSVPCVDCGESYHPAVMHFHHLGDKTIEVAKLVNRPLEVIKAEIAKCVVLCANCHIMRHINERTPIELGV